MPTLLMSLALMLSPATVPTPPNTTPPQAPDCVDEKSSDGPCAEQMTFRNDAYERMTVKVHVGGTGPYRFLVDTGADRSAVSSNLADSLKLERKASATLHSATGISDVALVRVPRMDLEGRSVEGVDAPVLQANDMGADGILGVDSLRSQRIVIDFRNEEICLTPSLKSEPKLSKDEIVITGRLKKGHLIFTRAEVDGEEVTVVIDTGAQVSIGNFALRDLLARHRKLGAPMPIEIKSVTGQTLSGNLHITRQIDLDGASVQNVAIMFADSETFRTINRERAPTLLLGMNALRGFDEVAIDLDRKKLRLRFPAPELRPALAGPGG